MFGSALRLLDKPYSEAALTASLAIKTPDGATLFADGHSCAIAAPPSPAPVLERALAKLQAVLETMTGAAFELQTQAAASITVEIKEDNPAYGTDGYRIVTRDGGLAICGASPLGAAYGIYGFLEDTLGCLWIAPDAEHIPRFAAIHLPPMDELHRPAMAWRNCFAYETEQNHWFDRLRLNGNCIPGENNGSHYMGWGSWCHTYLSFLPVEEYFDSHPAYYALQYGKRRRADPIKKQETQLCLTNPEVKRLVKQKLKEAMDAQPEKQYWDFSVMDSWMVKGCKCKNCRRLDKAAGSGMGSLLPLINELARAFPDKYISTLAYFHTIKPPKGLKAEKNVVIKLCSMPGSQASSYLEGGTKKAKDFQSFLESWKEIANHIVIWDYVINFKHLLLPFPNFTVQKENQLFYENNHVTGVFHQALLEQGNEMAELRTYVLSRLLWTGSSLDVEALMMKYLTLAYGDAAPFLAEYLERCSRYLYESQKELGLYDMPRVHSKGYLSPKAISTYLALFEKAEQAVRRDAVLLARVKKAKMAVLYAKMAAPSFDRAGRQRAAAEFFPLAAQHRIQKLAEIKMPMETFKKKWKQP